jgi:hypothetical protein
MSMPATILSFTARALTARTSPPKKVRHTGYKGLGSPAGQSFDNQISSPPELLPPEPPKSSPPRRKLKSDLIADPHCGQTLHALQTPQRPGETHRIVDEGIGRAAGKGNGNDCTSALMYLLGDIMLLEYLCPLLSEHLVSHSLGHDASNHNCVSIIAMEGRNQNRNSSLSTSLAAPRRMQYAVKFCSNPTSRPSC